MPDLSNVKAGDKLYVSYRLGGRRIEMVDKVMPSGRVKTKTGTFNPDGCLRGDIGIYARLATEDDFTEIARLSLIRKLIEYRGWSKLSTEDLQAVVSIMEKYR